MKRLALITLSAFALASLTGCESIAKKTGMSSRDLLIITAGAATRLQAEADRLKTEIEAAKAREAERLAALEITAAKQPVNVQP
jgi:outer membrane murein-binding lipoprotein Lpp